MNNKLYQEWRRQAESAWKRAQEKRKQNLPTYFYTFLLEDLHMEESDIRDLQQVAHINGHRVDFASSTLPTEHLLFQWFAFHPEKKREYSYQQFLSAYTFVEKLREYAPPPPSEEKKRSLMMNLFTFSWCKII